MPYIGKDGVPFIPTANERELTAEQLHELMSNAEKWFERKDVAENIDEACKETLKFLLDNSEVTDANGRVIAQGEWLPLSAVDTIDLDVEQKDLSPDLSLRERLRKEARLDLRFAALRVRIFTEGMTRMLNILDVKKSLPKFAANYIDPATDHVPWDIHQALMAYHLAGKDDKFLNLEEVKKSYSYAKETDANAVYGRLVYMTHLGLWKAISPAERTWQITVGQVAIAFHVNVFGPVLKAFGPRISKVTRISCG